MDAACALQAMLRSSHGGCGAQGRHAADDLGPAVQAVLRPIAFSSRSMRSCTRRIAKRSILVSVLPVLICSPMLRTCWAA
jgi:hypothetical protein